MGNRETRVEEAHRLSQMFIDISAKSKSDFADVVGSLGLPVHLARAVLMLTEPAPMRDLAERLTCDRSYITNLADQLEERGLVCRVPGSDRRVKLLQLTPAGVDLRDEISATVAERALVLRRLTPAERRTLSPLLEKLLRDDD
ncbi:MarR family winged helix-turn-helix transcriptional regulator [Kribbella sp. NPDC050470]|uniref:MarR family winged helix-turn-helix transcriptional regulator n=1 Tax=unclassified Kribbella TaxID=2644121 RepID=UPI003798EE74